MPPTQKKDDTDNAATSGDSAEVQVAEALGVSEGEVKALRHNAGLDQLAGHEANVHAWAASDAGQEFLKTEKDREAEEKAEGERIAKDLNKDNLTEAEVKYREAVDKAAKKK